jgi:hypothetical protein
MKWHTLLAVAIAISLCCGPSLGSEKKGSDTPVLAIEWQRLVDQEGETCDRCGGTEKELREGVETLRRSLKPLGIKVTLEKKSMGPESAKNIIDSNRIMMAGRPLEEWLGAKVGTSECGSCCAKIGEKVECRTTTLNGETYEVIPAQLIVKAGLKAASEIMTPPSTESCCPSAKPATGKDAKCCPK